MSTTELSEPAVDGPAEQTPGKRRRFGQGGPLSVVLLIAVVAALIIALGLSVYPGDKAPAKRVPHAAVIPPTPVLTALPIGQSTPGCFDPRSALDELVVCAGDLQGPWAYDGGLVQEQGRGMPECVLRAAGTPTAWVNLSNTKLHLREQVTTHSSAAAATAAVTAADAVDLDGSVRRPRHARPARPISRCLSPKTTAADPTGIVRSRCVDDPQRGAELDHAPGRRWSFRDPARPHLDGCQHRAQRSRRPGGGRCFGDPLPGGDGAEVLRAASAPSAAS